MTAEELIELAREMRQTQRQYFKARTIDLLNASKELERKFDLALKEYDDKQRKGYMRDAAIQIEKVEAEETRTQMTLF